MTQLNYRLNEGGGEAFYELGITDDGIPVGLTDEEASESLAIIEKITERLGAKFMIVRKEKASRGYVYELLIRRTLDVPPIQLSIALLGNVDAGKSTLKGVLISGSLDDGDGLAMSQVARYLHELKYRRSSSVSHHILGFDDAGASVNDTLSYNEAEIYLRSSKVITLVDLAGHERYLRTTLKGIMGSLPDYAAIIVAANAGPIGSFREHLGISLVLDIPIFIVMTKLDITPKEVLKRNLESLIGILKLPGVNKIPFLVKAENDCALAARNMPHGRVTPIFLVSNVTGEGLDLLKRFLNMIPPRINWSERLGGKFLSYVDEKFNVSGVGLVLSGLIESGSISVGQKVLLGPFEDGSFRAVRVKSIHVNRVNVERANAGQFATFAVTNVDYDEVRKGMVLVDDSRPSAVRVFRARVRVLHHPTTIKVGYEPVIHLKTIRQPAKLIDSSKQYLRTGDVAEVVFKFMIRPEYVRVGDQFVFREGRTKGIGEVISLVE
ncbi:GTP-binding protein [Candidatus Korarchaeum cryptofilum]|uniref:Elongation factor Tu domain protein n=1 Tax=Korarchaeum cryptofilum (strain OPF8) TaxID=374847 RepID=B1L766_KORCO|nr:GTP-binding protein [Candidatus Korarchaeum cryptofilum]ACB08295.1 elongation factor Tu domain protein [Candidatus Korarchaeum cryptofilum OPF8]